MGPRGSGSCVAGSACAEATDRPHQTFPFASRRLAGAQSRFLNHRATAPNLEKQVSSTKTVEAAPSPDHAVRERQLWRRLRDHHDPAAREELVHRYLPFARGMAMRYRHGLEPLDDLLQVANLGLLNAIDRFDPARGIEFRSYAAPTILGELKRHFRDRVWTVRMPRGAHDLLARIGPAVAKLTADLQRAPSVPEIAEWLEADPADVLDAFEAQSRCHALSLDGPLGEEDDGGEDSALGDWVGGEDPEFERVDDRLAVSAALPCLDARQREVLHLRFAEDLSQTEIAARIGCSQMQVSRILRRTFELIRETAAERPPKG